MSIAACLIGKSVRWRATGGQDTLMRNWPEANSEAEEYWGAPRLCFRPSIRTISGALLRLLQPLPRGEKQRERKDEKQHDAQRGNLTEMRHLLFAQGEHFCRPG